MCVQRKKKDVVGEFEENFHHLFEHLIVQKLGRGLLKNPADVTFKLLYNDHPCWPHSELMCRVFNLLLPQDKILCILPYTLKKKGGNQIKLMC